MSTAHDEGAGDELAGLVAKLTRNIEGMIRQLTALPIGAVGGDGHHGDEINHVESGVVRLRNAMRAADVVFAEYANAVVVNELHKRGGGRATPRSYLKRLFDITDTEARHLLAYRDALHPDPDPDPDNPRSKMGTALSPGPSNCASPRQQKETDWHCWNSWRLRTGKLSIRFP